jgi:hypothetical protein
VAAEPVDEKAHPRPIDQGTVYRIIVNLNFDYIQHHILSPDFIIIIFWEVDPAGLTALLTC